jgi:hypothetical protein
MKFKTNYFMLAFVLIATVISSCQSSNSSSNDAQTQEVASSDTLTSQESTTSTSESSNTPESIDGTYRYSDDSGAFEISIFGNQWSGKTLIKSGMGEEYDNQNAQYENGVVKDNNLYDSSGLSQIGYVSNGTISTTIAGQRITLSK